MQVYLLRHGIAEKESATGNDADRALTAEGKRKLRQVLNTAWGGETPPTLILTSPLKRALQTAEIAAEILEYKDRLLESRALLPSSTVEQVWDEVIRAHRDEPALLLVGHNPLFANLSGYLLGSPDVQVDFKKGALLRIDFEHFRAHPRGVLRWYLTPKVATSA